MVKSSDPSIERTQSCIDYSQSTSLKLKAELIFQFLKIYCPGKCEKPLNFFMETAIGEYQYKFYQYRLQA